MHKFGEFDNGTKMDLKAFSDYLSYSSKIIPDDLPEKILEYLKGKMNNCKICGNETPNPMYCSDACKQKGYRLKSNEKVTKKVTA